MLNKLYTHVLYICYVNLPDVTINFFMVLFAGVIISLVSTTLCVSEGNTGSKTINFCVHMTNTQWFAFPNNNNVPAKINNSMASGNNNLVC